jgi:hypothetical protein
MFHEAVVVYEGRGVTSRIRSLTAHSISIQSVIEPRPGETVTVFLDGLGRFDSRVDTVAPSRIDLSVLTDTQKRWRQLQDLRKRLSA